MNLDIKIPSSFKAIIASAILLSIFIYALGKNPIEVYSVLGSGSWGSKFSIIETLIMSIPLMLCGLSTALADRVGYLSLGADGQLYMGALGVIIFLHLIGFQNYSWPFLFFGMFVCSFLMGGFWGWLPGVLKIKFNVDITLSTLLMNFIAILLVQHLLQYNLKDPNTLNWPQSQQLPSNAEFCNFFDSRFYIGVLIAPVIALFIYGLFNYTKAGKVSNFIGSNIKVFEVKNIDYKLYSILFMSMSGAIAGISGFFLLSGVEGRLRVPISLGYGLTGFLISWFSRHKPIRIIFVSVFFASLITGSDNVQLLLNMPFSIYQIIQGLLFMLFLMFISKNR